MASDNSIDYSAIDYKSFKEALNQALHKPLQEEEEISELTAQEKAANLKAKQADIEAKKIALKHSEDELKKAQASIPDQK